MALVYSGLILAVDPGARSGWVIFAPDGRLLTAGETDSAHERDRVIASAKRYAESTKCNLYTVAETWTAGGWGIKQAMGTAMQWGKWLGALESNGMDRVTRVYPQTWRSLVIPGRQANSAAWKRAAQKIVKQNYQVDVGPDAADAICIGRWFIESGEYDRARERGTGEFYYRTPKPKPIRRNAKVGIHKRNVSRVKKARPK